MQGFILHIQVFLDGNKHYRCSNTTVSLFLNNYSQCAPVPLTTCLRKSGELWKEYTVVEGEKSSSPLHPLSPSSILLPPSPLQVMTQR